MTSDAPETDTVFIVGCPRSGTTWLQLLLAEHPRAVTVNETHLFSQFIGPAVGSWEKLAASPREIGLKSVVSDSEFRNLLRRLTRATLDRIAGEDTQLVVEKTPEHALHGDLILATVPDAYVLHLVRDPRDVTASLLAASETWGTDWAPTKAYSAARMWLTYVKKARAIRSRTPRFRELRYEDLFNKTEEKARELFDWLSLDASDAEISRMVSATRLENLRETTSETANSAGWTVGDEPSGFFRKGGSGNWRAELSGSEVATVEHLCRTVMEAYGYEVRRQWRVPPLRVVLRRLYETIRGQLR